MPRYLAPESTGPSSGGAMNASTPRPVPPTQPKNIISAPVSAPIVNPPSEASKIKAFENKMSGARHEDKWSRTPNVTGHGAIHVKSFHCKLSDDSLGYLDQQVNEWLDAHPQYEVKFVTTSIGEWSGKLGKEPHIVVQVWV